MRTFRQLVALAVGIAAVALASPVPAREINHAMGVTDVPDHPQRVVMLTNEGTEALLHLGVMPVGAVQSWDGDPWYAHLAAPLAQTIPLGTESAVNLEILASLEPDLIIGNKVRQEKIYDQLAAVAPTVFAENLSGNWQKNYQFYADVLGLGEQGTANLAAFDTRAAAIGASLGERINDEISLVRFSPGRTRIYYNDTFAGVILGKVGLKRSAAQDRQEFAEEVQKERIPDMDGDRIFYFSADADPDDATANLSDWTSDPLWLRLDGVKAGNARRVSEMVWNSGGGIYCAHMMLDDLSTIYGVDPQALN